MIVIQRMVHTSGVMPITISLATPNNSTLLIGWASSILIVNSQLRQDFLQRATSGERRLKQMISGTSQMDPYANVDGMKGATVTQIT